MDPLLATLRGVHTIPAFQWAQKRGVVHTLGAGALFYGTAGDQLLSEMGWTVTNLNDSSSAIGGNGAKLPNASWTSLSFGTPGSILTDGANDLLQSPAIFADPIGFYTAGKLLGSTKPPLKFMAEWWGALTVDSANEVKSGFGLFRGGGTVGVTADTIAWIFSDGTNMRIESSAGTLATLGPAITEQLLLHRLVVTRSDLAVSAQTIEWLTSPDGITFTSRAKIPVVDTKAPYGFGMFADTTNRPAIYGDSFFYYI